MKYNMNEFSALPEILSLEDVRRFCHISKRNARYYLQSGLIPCRISRQKTHCYSITKEQLKSALQNFEEMPAKFAVPIEISGGGHWGDGKVQALAMLSEQDIKTDFSKIYYQSQLADLPDVMTTADVSKLTGYGSATINEWCNQGALPFLNMHPRRLIAKKNLLSFLLSKDYNNIAHKSKKHLADIRVIHKTLHKGG